MQSYLINLNTNLNNKYQKKIQYIISKYFSKHIINHDNIELYINPSKYGIIKLFLDSNYKTYFISIDFGFNPVHSKLLEQIELLNNNLDNFDCVEELIYKLNYIIQNIIQFDLKPKTIEVIEKNPEKFKLNLESLKEKYFDSEFDKSIYKSKLFTFRANIEMLSDQLTKIYMDPRFDFKEICDFNRFAITIGNFTFKNSSKLSVIIILDSVINWIDTPPNITLFSSTPLKDNILNVIEQLKPFNDVKSWSIKYSIYTSLVSIYNMINLLGEVKNEHSTTVDKLIEELEYLFSIKDKNISHNKLLEIFDKELVGLNNLNNLNNLNSSNTKNNGFWKKGIGYGHEHNNPNNQNNTNTNNKWNIDEYIKNINSKRKNINAKMSDFINLLTSSNITKYTETIINLFYLYLNDDQIKQEIIIQMADIIWDNKNIVSIQNEKSIQILHQIKEYLIENSIQHELLIKTKENEKINKIINNKINSKLDDFQKIFNEFKFRFIDYNFTDFYFERPSSVIKIVTNNNILSSQISRLQKEFVILKKSIIINKMASIFFYVNSNSIQKMRFLITGPIDTPYSYGLFVFDMGITNEFPNKPPVVYLINNGSKRMNPNLYESGKVCLSLLGTWASSDKGETWNSETSTFNQLLISIQAQILVDEPYFNEPGYEKNIGKPQGIQSSKKYNYNIRKYTLDHTINDMLVDVIIEKKRFTEFDNLIRNYFKYNKQNIINQNNKWYEEMPDNLKPAFKNSMDVFVSLVNKL